MAMTGLILAIGAGVLGFTQGTAFMQHFGQGIFSTVMLFDIGVFLAVWGGFNGYVLSLLERPVTESSKSTGHRSKEFKEAKL
jgi:hypothetical protein